MRASVVICGICVLISMESSCFATSRMVSSSNQIWQLSETCEKKVLSPKQEEKKPVDTAKVTPTAQEQVATRSFYTVQGVYSKDRWNEHAVHPYTMEPSSDYHRES